MALQQDFLGHGTLNGTGTGQGLNPYDAGNGVQNLGCDWYSEIALNRMRTAGSISISLGLFEELYLSPKNRFKGDLRKTCGNPTPLYVQHDPSATEGNSLTSLEDPYRLSYQLDSVIVRSYGVSILRSPIRALI